MAKTKSPQKSKPIITAFRSLVEPKVSQFKLAEVLGCSQQKISQIEKGQVSLKQGDADRIAQVLGVDPDLLGGDSDE